MVPLSSVNSHLLNYKCHNPVDHNPRFYDDVSCHVNHSIQLTEKKLRYEQSP